MKVRHQLCVLLAGVSTLAAQSIAWGMPDHTNPSGAMSIAENPRDLQELYNNIIAVKGQTSLAIIQSLAPHLTSDTIGALFDLNISAYDQEVLHEKIITILVDDFCAHGPAASSGQARFTPQYLEAIKKSLDKLHNTSLNLVTYKKDITPNIETLQDLVRYVNLKESDQTNNAARRLGEKISMMVMICGNSPDQTPKKITLLKASLAGIICPRQDHLITTLAQGGFPDSKFLDLVAASILMCYPGYEKNIWSQAIIHNNYGFFTGIDGAIWLLDQLENPQRRDIFPSSQSISDRLLGLCTGYCIRAKDSNVLVRFLELLRHAHVARPAPEAFITAYREAVKYGTSDLATVLAPFVPVAERLHAHSHRRIWGGYLQGILNSGNNVTDEQRQDAYIDHTGNW